MAGPYVSRGFVGKRRAPGVVLRRAACGGVVLRPVEAPGSLTLDARRAAYLRLERG